jgi:UDP-2,4-diacetamido-2,4,6-trideoxy-beta-L-altropyranose hydrolase
MRCLALADALRQRGGHVRFITRQLPSRMRELACGRGHEVVSLAPASRSDTDELAHAHWLGTSQSVDAQLSIEALAGRHVQWLVVDHYALDARWESALRQCAARILVIDDLADRSHDCDVLLDQNLPDDRARYAARVPAHCRLLLGPRFALLREEFRRARGSMRARDGTVKRVLILMGGVDAQNLTAKAMEAVSRVPRPLEVDVVIGAQNPAQEEIAEACRRHGYALHVQPPSIAELMVAADLAVGAGGCTTWERCCLGLPALALCAAENQRGLVDEAVLSGLVYAPGRGSLDMESLVVHLRALIDSPLLLRAMSRNALRAVDGRGTQRVLRALGCGEVGVREATPADCGRIFAWRNHPDIRRASGNSAPIELAAHESWFAAVLADPARHLLLGEFGDETVGVVRFDVASGEAQVSIYLAPGLTGEGRGAELLHAAESWLAAKRPEVLTLKAKVLRDNRASHGLFEACGYRKSSTLYAKEASRP